MLPPMLWWRAQMVHVPDSPSTLLLHGQDRGYSKKGLQLFKGAVATFL